MAADTTQRITAELSQEVARALWGAMHDDDDLASWYADLAIVHALRHLIRDVKPRSWKTEKYVSMLDNLERATRNLEDSEAVMAKRWELYAEPPF